MSSAYFAEPIRPHAFPFASHHAHAKPSSDHIKGCATAAAPPAQVAASESEPFAQAPANASPARPKRAAAALATASLTSPPKASSSTSPKKVPIQPAYFYPSDLSSSIPATPDDGVPVFEPTMEEFADFEAYCEAIDAWGMRSGIVKVVPPPEWRKQLPSLQLPPGEEDSAPRGIASVRIRNAISQNWVPAGSGLWRQQNVVHPAKMWNALQWAEVCASEAQRGPEISRMKANAGRTRGAADATEEDGVRTRSGRAREARPTSSLASNKRKRPAAPRPANDQDVERRSPSMQPPVTSSQLPSSLALHPTENGVKADIPQGDAEVKCEERSSPTRVLRARPGAGQENDAEKHNAAHLPETSPSKPANAPPKPKAADLTTEAEWAAFDHETCWLREAASDPGDVPALSADGPLQPDHASQRKSIKTEEDAGPVKTNEPSQQPSADDWRNAETCREIEAEYWRGLNFGKPPMYGADLKGTLFTPETTAWNVGNLPNILTRLRLKRKLPGVTTPYLYFGMWRATFAWHVEDVDLYSINYIHFGAPKQWYSIRQADKTRFENAMAGAFPSDARRCKHFMRHKSYLASPAFLAAHNIKPLRLVHHAGEFVITYPYGYHSGFNMGFNCAESVNFALQSWLDIGRRAGWCQCEEWSVRMDVDAILKESEEMIEADRKREQRALLRQQHEAGEQVDQAKLDARRAARREYEAKRRKAKAERMAVEANGEQLDDAGVPAKKSRPSTEHKDDAQGKLCVFCVSDFDNPHVLIEQAEAPATPLYAHDLCANFVPETWMETREDGVDVVKGYAGIPKARRALKCALCPKDEFAKQGIKVQCTYGSCTRAAHIGCAYLESTNWRLDVLPKSKADIVEGRKKGAKANKRQILEAMTPEQAEVDLANEETRHVVLCSTHNPTATKPMSASALRNAAIERTCALQLKAGDMCSIKLGGHETLVPVVRVVDSTGELPDVEGAVHGSVSYFYKPDEERFVKWCHIVFGEQQRAQAAAEHDASQVEAQVEARDDTAVSATKRQHDGEAEQKTRQSDGTTEPPKKKPRKPADPSAPKKPRKSRTNAKGQAQDVAKLDAAGPLPLQPPIMSHTVQMTPSPAKPLLEESRYAMPPDPPLTPDSSNGTPPQLSHSALLRREPAHGAVASSAHHGPQYGYAGARYYPPHGHGISASFAAPTDSRHAIAPSHAYHHPQVPYNAAYAHHVPLAQVRSEQHGPQRDAYAATQMHIPRPEDALNSLAAHAATMQPAASLPSSSARSGASLQAPYSPTASSAAYDARYAHYPNVHAGMSSSSPPLLTSSATSSSQTQMRALPPMQPGRYESEYGAYAPRASAHSHLPPYGQPLTQSQSQPQPPPPTHRQTHPHARNPYDQAPRPSGALPPRSPPLPSQHQAPSQIAHAHPY